MRFGLNLAASDLNRAVGVNKHIHFAANPEFRQIDTWFDREQRSRQNAASFVSLQVVNVSSVAVGFPPQTVPRAMAEGIFETGF